MKGWTQPKSLKCFRLCPFSVVTNFVHCSRIGSIEDGPKLACAYVNDIKHKGGLNILNGYIVLNYRTCQLTNQSISGLIYCYLIVVLFSKENGTCWSKDSIYNYHGGWSNPRKRLGSRDSPRLLVIELCLFSWFYEIYGFTNGRIVEKFKRLLLLFE